MKFLIVQTHPFAPDMHHTSKLPHRQVSSQTRDTMFCEHLKLSGARNKHTQAYPPLKLAAKAPKNGWLEDNPFLSGRLFLKLWFSGKAILTTCADPTKFPKETLPNSMAGVQKHIQPNVLMWWCGDFFITTQWWSSWKLIFMTSVFSTSSPCLNVPSSP